MSFDPTTYVLAKKYTDSQRLGYSAYEKSTGIGFSGDIADKATIEGEVFGFSGTYVHVSDEVYTGGTLFRCMLESGSNTHVLSKMKIIVSDDGIWFLINDDDGFINFPLVISFGSNIAEMLNVPHGVYFWTGTITDDTYSYVSYLDGRFIETIHPIDPKYLPGVCLPVVALETSGIQPGDPIPLGKSDSAKLTAVEGRPAIICFDGMAMVFSSASYNSSDVPYTEMFIAGLGISSFQFAKQDGAWIAIVASSV